MDAAPYFLLVLYIPDTKKYAYTQRKVPKKERFR